MFRILCILTAAASFGSLHAQPANDGCRDAELIEFQDSANSVVEGDTATGATLDRETIGCGRSQAPGVWYRVVGNGGLFRASTCNDSTSYDTRLSVYSGS